jgi:natural product precursor
MVRSQLGGFTMKKVVIKKLVLSKETIADLDMSELNNVRGGQVSKYCGTGVHCTFGCDGPAVTPGTICC